MKRLIYLIAMVCILGFAGCEKDEKCKITSEDFDFGTTEITLRQATRIELKTTGLSISEGTVQSVGVEYRKAGENEWNQTAGSLSEDGKSLTTKLIGLTENTGYEYRVWAKVKSAGTLSASESATTTTRHYYEIEYTSEEKIEGIFATISFSGIAFYENGIATGMNAYEFSYRKAGDTAWITQQITPANGACSVSLPAEGTLTEQTGYEYKLSCDYYTQSVTDNYGHKFETTTAAVSVIVRARSVIGTASGVICAAEITLTLDGKLESVFETCSVDYREKGSETWKNAEGTKINDLSLQAIIPAVQLMAGKSYEYRYNVGRRSTTWTEGEVREFKYGAQEVSAIAGEWKLYSFNGNTNLSYTVYLGITAANRFELYQHFGQPSYDKFTGTISVMSGCVSGIYDDGMVWGASYKLEIVDSSTMKWTNLQDVNEVSVYKRGAIPSTILRTRSAATDPVDKRFL